MFTPRPQNHNRDYGSNTPVCNHGHPGVHLLDDSQQHARALRDHPETGNFNRAISILYSFVNDVFKRILQRQPSLQLVTRSPTITRLRRLLSKAAQRLVSPTGPPPTSSILLNIQPYATTYHNQPHSKFSDGRFIAHSLYNMGALRNASHPCCTVKVSWQHCYNSSNVRSFPKGRCYVEAQPPTDRVDTSSTCLQRHMPPPLLRSAASNSQNQEFINLTPVTAAKKKPGVQNFNYIFNACVEEEPMARRSQTLRHLP
ncbi:uncharacterized protein RSE6_12998 [Rhynchosporium secalis]|uniref:Uncharacterized protein n=1 Tax=Rhynchosporium secalis TaxID=38038 RepID=A0A1E1MRT2_RHYSE|nr:uncharacterized protein RSE6_12998 [Rhynchosporium secalis]